MADEHEGNVNPQDQAQGLAPPPVDPFTQLMQIAARYIIDRYQRPPPGCFLRAHGTITFITPRITIPPYHISPGMIEIINLTHQFGAGVHVIAISYKNIAHEQFVVLFGDKYKNLAMALNTARNILVKDAATPFD